MFKYFKVNPLKIYEKKHSIYQKYSPENCNNLLLICAIILNNKKVFFRLTHK